MLSGGVVSNFLWKPKSERDGSLVVLLSPANARITVNGERLTDFGPSNGRGTTARAQKSGCAFGRATVEVTDAQGLPILFPGNKTKFIIENGCDRVQFQ